MRRTIRRLGPTLGLILSITVCPAAVATAQTWTGASPTSNNWTDPTAPTNWDTGVPVNDGSAAIIYTGTTPRLTSTVDVNYDVNTITFQGGAATYIINQAGGSTLTIEGGITDSSTSVQTMTVPITLGTMISPNQTWTVNSGGQLNVNGAITGNGGTFTKAGAGILQFGSAGNNSFGPISITAGTLQASTSMALPDVDYTITGGTLNANGTTQTILSAALSGSGAIATGSGGNLTVTGAVTMAGTSSVNLDAGTMTVGSLTGSSTTANLTVGTGHFTDNSTGTDTFSGLITMNSGGTFELGGAAGGSLTLMNTGNGGAGTGGTVQIDTGKTLIAGADGSLSLADYVVNGSLNAQGHNFSVTSFTGAGAIDLGSATVDIVNATGTPSYSGTITGTTSGGNTPSIRMDSGTQTLTGTISGSTNITANGGVLTLNNAVANTYTGGTTLAGTSTSNFGTVAIFNDNNLGAATSTLTFNGGVLQINGTTGPTSFGSHNVNFTTFNGGIDIQDPTATFTISQGLGANGANPLLINPNGGDGTVILTGANVYSTTTISSGTLQVGNGGTTGTLGTGAVTDNGNLTIDHDNPTANPFTISNSITGTGTMHITGGTVGVPGVVVLSGANALTGDTTIDANNTLKGAVGNIPGNVVDNGTLDFTQTTDATFGNTINGTGTVIKDGAGTLSLSNTNSYGPTTVNAGRLDITGTTTSSTVTVAAKNSGNPPVAGGTLGGTGTLNGDIVNNGTVSPGTTATPLGTLTQTGQNYTGNSGSQLNINVNGAPGSNSMISGTGTATLNSGSNLHVIISGNNFTNGGTYTAIDATTAVRDAGATIDTNAFFVRAAFVNSASDIQFTLNQNFVPVSGATFNQIQLGTYLNNNMANTNTDFMAVLAGLNSISDGAAARAALTQITGDIHPSIAQINVNNTQIVIGQVASRLRASNFAPGGPLGVADGRSLDGSDKSNSGLTPVAFVGCDESGMPEFEGGEQCCGNHWSAWGIGYGMGGSSEFDGNATGISFGTGGVVAGMERWEDDCHLMGFYGAYVGSSISTVNGQDATMNGGQFGGYMFGDDGFNYYTVLGGFEFDGDTTNRRLAFGTGTAAISDQNSSNYSDWQTFVYAERGMSFQSCNHVLQPFVGVQYVFVRQDGFTETGGNNTSLDLTGSGDTTNSLRSMVGARMQYAVTSHSGRRTLPEIHALWVHEYLDTSNGLSATMVPIGGTPFIVQGLNTGRDWGLVGGNYTWEMLNGWSMFVNYDLQTSIRSTYHVGSGGLGYRW